MHKSLQKHYLRLLQVLSEYFEYLKVTKCALYVCHTHVLDLISPHHSSKQAESVASFSMNVDELPYRGMLILIQLDVSVSVFLLVCTIMHLCILPVNVLALCAWVSVFREVKVENVGESNSRQASDGL